MIVRNKEITIATVNAKPAVEKLLTMSTKVALVKDEQNVNIKKI